MSSVRPSGKSLQETYFSEGTCFGCGPKNDKGLRIHSFAEDADRCVCTFRPEAHHEAFPGVLNGGICGTLLDCHSNWTAAWHLMQKMRGAAPPCTVTSEFAVKLRRPTPSGTDLIIRAHVIESTIDRAVVESNITVDGRVTATCRGTFVAVEEGHPAFHRW